MQYWQEDWTKAIGDKISWDTLLTEDTSKDTFIVFKEK